jgi:FixJ family two-component response regulator
MMGVVASRHRISALPNNKKVIVVDDDPSVLKGIARLLKMSGFDPILFDSAESCFEDIRDISGACCLVIDIHLRGKSGFELKQALGEKLPVIFMTASDSEVGCVAFLRKPFPAKSLIDPIKTIVGGSGLNYPH